MPGQYNVVGFESLPVAGTAVSLTRVARAKSYVGRVELDSDVDSVVAVIRMRGDGTAPTSTVGVPLHGGDVIVLNDSEIDRTQFIQISASCTIEGHYYSTEAGMFT